MTLLFPNKKQANNRKKKKVAKHVYSHPLLAKFLK